MIYMSFWPFELVRNGQYWLVVWGWRGGEVEGTTKIAHMQIFAKNYAFICIYQILFVILQRKM